jgi:hypothetical protein
MRTGTRVYYELPDWLAEGSSPIEPFPYDFQMSQYLLHTSLGSADLMFRTVWGDPARKTYNGSNMFDWSNDYYCELGNSHSFGSKTLPTVPCLVSLPHRASSGKHADRFPDTGADHEDLHALLLERECVQSCGPDGAHGLSIVRDHARTLFLD